MLPIDFFFLNFTEAPRRKVPLSGGDIPPTLPVKAQSRPPNTCHTKIYYGTQYWYYNDRNLCIY